MDLSEMVFDVGVCVTGWGEIRADDDGVWFDPPHAIPLIGLPPGKWLPRSDNAIRLLDHDPGHDTAGTGSPGGGQWSTITGIWVGEAIKILSHVPTSPSDRYPEPMFPDWTVPPCPAPDQGWPAGTQQDLMELDLADLRASENCVTTVTYRPRNDSVVLVVAATDVATAEEQWRPLLGARLCVVQSRWSKRQLEEVTDVLLGGWQHWAISMISRPVDDHAQSSVDTEVLRVPPDLAKWAAGLPDGILEVRPTLTPVGVSVAVSV